MQGKVKQGIRMLQDHFDLVMIDGNGGFAEEILKVTWLMLSDKQAKKGLLYSKDLVSKYGKKSAKIGDADFIDAVNQIYHNGLDFLLFE